MAAPPITERHLPHFHRRSPVKESVRVATTANITIATALNNGDSLDGITLATDDRVLVKDQSTGSQNGIYVVGVTPVRAYDQSTDDPAFGFIVQVRAGTANAGTVWLNTNVSTPTIDTTALTFAQIGAGFSLTIKDEGGALATAATSIDFVGAGVVASGATAAKTVTISGAPTGAAGGDLSGTYPNPSVVDDSHSHTAATLPAASTGSGDHEHMVEVFSGDGSTTAFEIANEPVDAEEVFAFVAGSWTAVTVSGTMSTTVTFGSAPASASNNVVIQYPAIAA